MEVLNSGVFGGIFILGFLEFTMKRISCLLPILAAASFSYAAVNLGVSLSDSIKPVTHVATGSLYGLTETLPSDITKDVAPLKPNVFLSPARSGNGRQQGIGGAFLVAPRVESIGAKIQIRLADVLPGWPYKFQNMNHWKNEVTSVINDKLKSNNKNFDGYEIWNEPDGTWKNENGDFNSVLWKQTYDLIRKLDPTAKIIGPSYSYYSSSRMDAFVKYCAQNNCMPDVISWHQWGSANFVNTVESYRSIEKKYNVSPRPFSINEYSSEVHEEEGCPGVSVPFIAKFERHGVESAMISWWFVPLPGRLGSLLTKNNERGGGWWLYKWYGDMSGYMAKVTPPNDKSDGVDGFAALDKKKGFASIVLGGNTRGDVNVNISGIPESFGNKVNVDVEYVTWENKDKAVPSTTLESSKEYDVSGGKITVPVNIKNVKYGYRVYVTAIVPQAPYKDTAMAIPGKVEVENYDVGGPGKAFLDKDDDNKGGEYRDDAVDIVKVADGYAVGYTQEGEWLEYTVNVAESQEYALSIRYATTSENVGAKLYVDDKAVLEEVTFPKGTDWDTYAVHEAGMVSLSAGKHVLKLEIVGNYVNIDWLDFADSKTTAVKGTRMLPLVTQRRAAYSVFDTQGRFVASFTAVGDEEARVKVYAAVKHAGLYLVKPQSGGRMFRMAVK
jgi:hypothetical protein